MLMNAQSKNQLSAADQATRAKTLIRYFAIPAALVIGFTIIFVALEIFCHIVGQPYSEKLTVNETASGRFDSELGWSYIPNLSTVKTYGTAKRAVHLYFDENGIRVPTADTKLDPTRPSVLFVGCSVTMGHGLPYEESLAGQFGALREVPYQVVNLGVQGYGTDQSLLMLKRFLPKFNTKVVVYTLISDHPIRNKNYDRRMLVPNLRYLGTKPLFKVNRKNELYLARKPLLYKDYRNSRLVDFIIMRLGGMLDIFPPYGTKLAKALIQEMKRYTEAQGVRFVMINWRWTQEDFIPLDFFKGLDLEDNLIDTLKDAPPDFAAMRIPGDGHPDARANAHVARLLLKYFESRNLV